VCLKPKDPNQFSQNHFPPKNLPLVLLPQLRRRRAPSHAAPSLSSSIATFPLKNLTLSISSLNAPVDGLHLRPFISTPPLISSIFGRSISTSSSITLYKSQIFPFLSWCRITGRRGGKKKLKKTLEFYSYRFFLDLLFISFYFFPFVLSA